MLRNVHVRRFKKIFICILGAIFLLQLVFFLHQKIIGRTLCYPIKFIHSYISIQLPFKGCQHVVQNCCTSFCIADLFFVILLYFVIIELQIHIIAIMSLQHFISFPNFRSRSGTFLHVCVKKLLLHTLGLLGGCVCNLMERHFIQ